MIRLHGWSRILALSFCAKSGPISIGKISLKKKDKFKIQKSSDFGLFQSIELRKKVIKSPHFSTLFLMCSQIIER
jgi:hypothetical protein